MRWLTFEPFRCAAALAAGSLLVTACSDAAGTGAGPVPAAAAAGPASAARHAATAPVPAASAAPSPAAYAPVNQAGPPLSPSAAQLTASLSCSPKSTVSKLPPILLVPGTTLTPSVNFAWNYERAFTANGMAWCAVTLPDNAMGDISIAGEYVVHAIRTMAKRAGGKIDILGYSQGGMVPRWALRFWPDTRALVESYVALDPSNHGTVDAYAICTGDGCAPAIWQQETGANFLAALNSGAETFAGIAYTVVYSDTDEVVVPNLPVASSSSLSGGGGKIANISVQSICPNDVSEHLAMGSYDPVGYALAIDAFTHGTVANPADVPLTTCASVLQPGVDPTAFPTNYATYVAYIGDVLATTPHVAAEPALPSYVYAKP